MESSVESLNTQLSDMSSNESLMRMKHQHESVVSGLQRKFDFDLDQLNQKLDLAARDAVSKV